MQISCKSFCFRRSLVRPLEELNAPRVMKTAEQGFPESFAWHSSNSCARGCTQASISSACLRMQSALATWSNWGDYLYKHRNLLKWATLNIWTSAPLVSNMQPIESKGRNKRQRCINQPRNGCRRDFWIMHKLLLFNCQSSVLRVLIAIFEHFGCFGRMSIGIIPADVLLRKTYQRFHSPCVHVITKETTFTTVIFILFFAKIIIL